MPGTQTSKYLNNLKNQPRVTVYITTKDRYILLCRAIESVLNQDYDNQEIIIIDDNSSDATTSIKSEYAKHPHIHVIRNESTLGACASRNKAILAATGEYITGLDDDDYFSARDRVSTFIECMANENGDASVLFDSINILQKTGKQTLSRPEFVDERLLRQANHVGNQVFAKKEIFFAAGLFDPEMPAWQDWDLWYRMAKGGAKFKNINKFSYTVDETHDTERISAGNPSRIISAKTIFLRKLKNPSIIDKSNFIIAALQYKNVYLKPKDLLILILAGRLRAIIKYATRFRS